MKNAQQRRAVPVSDLTEEEIAMIAAAEVPDEFGYEIDDIERDQSEVRQQLPIKNTETPH